MKVSHLFEDHVYLISNHAVARNPMFAGIQMREFFVSRMEKYLKPICKVIAMNLNNDEFQLLLKLRSRESFEAFYKQKAGKENLKEIVIPESTYIFSQEMANLQVSLVKHFNFKHQRSGTMMAGRFSRELIESEEDMSKWIDRLNAGKKLHNYAKIWLNDIMTIEKNYTSKWLYNSGFSNENHASSMYLNGLKADLGGSFANLPPAKIQLPKSYLTIQLNLILNKLYPKS